jgi:hypothetical protein
LNHFTIPVAIILLSYFKKGGTLKVLTFQKIKSLATHQIRI